MRIRYFQPCLADLVILVQPLLLLSFASPLMAQQTTEAVKEREKIEQQSEKIKIAAEKAKIKAQAETEKNKIKAEEAAERAKIKEEEAALRAKERAEHGRHSRPPAPTPPAPAPSPAPVSGSKGVWNGVQLFPTNSIFYADISKMPVDPRSDAWLAHISGGGAAGSLINPGMGPCASGQPIAGNPVNVVGPNQAMVPYKCNLYCSEASSGPVPMPPNGLVEGSLCPGGPVNTAGGDMHSIVLQTGTKDKTNLWEFYQYGTGSPLSIYNADGSLAGFMADWNMSSNQMLPAGYTSACAAGWPMLPFLLKYEEVQAGAINHALYVSINWVTDNACVWPASHTISSGPNDPVNYPPMGACLRLKADFDISPYNAETQTVLKALKTYGMYVGDVNGGGNVNGLEAVFNPNWLGWGAVNGLFHTIYGLPAIRMNNFDYVDVSSLMVSPDSYEAKSTTESVSNIDAATSSGASGTSGLQLAPHHSNTGPRKN